MSDRLSAAQWTDFWQAGSITTFMGRFTQNYDGVILEFWRTVFDRQSDAANIVDLATGNGALALLASQYSEAKKKSFVVTGVDYATTNPKEMLKKRGFGEALESIKFLPGTLLEKTGLPKHSFDLVCSQFGFEYAQAGEAVAEVDRLLKTGGSMFAAMLHVEGSVIMEQAQEGIRQVMQCRKSSLVAEAEQLLAAVAAAKERGDDPTTDPACVARRESTNVLTGKLHSAQNQYKDPGQIAFFLSSVMALFDQRKSGQLDLQSKLTLLHKIQPESEKYLQRMRDMISSALSDEEIGILETALKTGGADIESSETVYFKGRPFCHALIAVR